MHINRKPEEQVVVDMAGNPVHITDPDADVISEVYLFVGVMTYSKSANVEVFINERQEVWIKAHVHMYQFFGGTARILVPDNCKTIVIHNCWRYNQQGNTVYHEMAERYNTAIIPTKVRKAKDKFNAECSVGNVSIWITVALRNEQFFSLLN